ncbi:MAG: hypothetical protein L0271_12840 [Gemmatimonadetes bacterium]|nr:hypothetical protein [Gemmatimonadota bacterium]
MNTGGISWALRCAILLVLACDPGARAPALDFPARPRAAAGGVEIARDVRDLQLEAREDRIFAEVARGNVPTWLRELRPVEMVRAIDGREHDVTFWVTPDYLAVGSDTDAFLVPLSPRTAQRIADLVGGSLPTPPMVDAIWAAASVRLVPIRLNRDDSTRTVAYFERHDRLVHAQRMLHDVPPGTFVAGHKLDVVLSARLSGNPGNVAVYGWHFPDGQPIQNLSTALPESRVGYSHGIRIVHPGILVDGVSMDLLDVLRDPELAPLLSDDGPIAEPRYPVDNAARRHGG